MASLGIDHRNLARYKRTWANRLATAELRAPGPGPHLPSPLEEVTGFGSNPGELTMLTYVPENLADSPALVVVLHGCTQTAAELRSGAGWSTLADRYGFVAALPEQQAGEQSQDAASTGFCPATSTAAGARRCRSARWSSGWSVDARHRPRARLRHRPVRRRRDDIGHAGDLSGGVRRRRHHRGPALWHCATACRRPSNRCSRADRASAEGMGRSGARRVAASRVRGRACPSGTASPMPR